MGTDQMQRLQANAGMQMQGSTVQDAGRNDRRQLRPDRFVTLARLVSQSVMIWEGVRPQTGPQQT